ncbi:acyl-CoA thioesterase [Pontivivens ytuae]|nr:thioesterase family protein [Pontivivens ytuae]
MDSAFHEMTTALGFDQAALPAHGVFATPLRDAGATFHAPARPNAHLDLSVRITRMGTSSFSLGYAFTDTGRAIAEGREDRVCVRQEADGGITKAPLPPKIRALLETYRD